MPSINVAITDDHLLILSSLVQHVNSFENCKVIMQANDGAELLEQLESAAAVPDVCILDINMPILNGYKTLLEMKRLYPDIRVIVLTAFVTDFAIIRMIQNGASAYLPKNCRSEELREAIHTLATSKYFYSDMVPKRMFDRAKTELLPEFTTRELEFLRWCCRQLRYNEIAKKMYVSERTVENYFNSISRKVHIKDRGSLIAFAKDSGLVYTTHDSEIM